METLKSGFGLLEAPIWDETRGLLFADADNGGVHCLDPHGNVSTIVKHRRGIGGAVRHRDGGLIVSGRNVAYKDSSDGPTVVLLDRNPERGIVGFNDITTDSKGRIYAGALGFLPTETALSGIGGDRKSAPLFLIDRDGSTRIVHPSVELTNGLGISPDGSLLYHADSGSRMLYVYDVASDGGLANRRVFASVPEGLPDGVAVSMDGCVWLAVAHAGKVVRFSPSGAREAEIEFPVPMVTSLCFGGPDRRDMYVVSGSEGTGKPDAGSVFRLKVDVAGVDATPADVRIGER
jgi:xylono-1,5-lactonase